jgi:four helix bundle suffix protein
MPSPIIPKHGGYQNLHSYQKSVAVYDLTVIFCRRFLSRGDRTVDQMIQAARSGKQNIVEGSMASGTSAEMEIKLTSVARSSLEELLEDYRDFLRSRNMQPWQKDGPEALYMRQLGRCLPEKSGKLRQLAELRGAAVVANIGICLVHQTNYLLDCQLRRLQQAFVEKGGLRERMSAARRQARGY